MSTRTSSAEVTHLLNEAIELSVEIVVERTNTWHAKAIESLLNYPCAASNGNRRSNFYQRRNLCAPQRRRLKGIDGEIRQFTGELQQTIEELSELGVGQFLQVWSVSNFSVDVRRRLHGVARGRGR